MMPDGPRNHLPRSGGSGKNFGAKGRNEGAKAKNGRASGQKEMTGGQHFSAKKKRGKKHGKRTNGFLTQNV